MTREQMPKGARRRPLARAVLRTQSDDRLVRLVREGRDGAFDEIVRRYRQPLVAFAAAYGPPDPEDVVQESLTRSWQSLRQSTGEMKLKPWLYTIVRNRALNAKRDARTHDELTDRIDGVPQPADLVLTNDELARVVAAVGALPHQQREALVRSALEGHTHEQIAAAIGATPGAVRQLIFRGRMAVRHGVGVLIPLPLVRMLAESGAAAEVGAGGAAAASGGAAITGGAAGAGAGASLAAKAAIVVAVGAVAAGSGVAIDRSHNAHKASQPPAREIVSEVSRPRTPAAPAPTPVDETSGSGEAEPGDDHGGSVGDSGGGPGPSGSSGSGTSGSSSGSSGSGPSPSSGPGDDGDLEGPADSSSDSGSAGSGSAGHGSSGSSGSDDGGSSGSGSSGSGSSGSGPSGSDDSIDSSGSSDSSGSGDLESGGSGSDDGLDSSGSGPAARVQGPAIRWTPTTDAARAAKIPARGA